MPTLKEAKDKVRALSLEAMAVVEDRTLTTAEQALKLNALDADIKAAVKDVSNLEYVDEKRAEFARATGHDSHDAYADGGDGQRKEQPKSFARQVVESDGYKSMLSGQTKGVTIDVKAAATIDEGIIPAFSGGAGMAGQLVAPQLLSGITGLKFQPLTVADLLASGTTSSSSVSYVIESAFQDLTATVAEKGTKPQLDLTLARRQDNVTKIANVAKITDEMFQDAPQFEAYLRERMVFGVQRVEEAQLLNGNGTPPNLQGILQRSGLATAVVTAAGLTAVKAMEGIFNQITALRAVSFVEPDALVIHPTDWQTIRLGKDSNGQYYAGGPFTGAYGNPGPTNVGELWGLRAVITTAIAQGTVLVGGFRECAQVFRRQGVTLEMTNSNVDDFVNNLITLRAEERLALAVYRPAGFGKVTLTA